MVWVAVDLQQDHLSPDTIVGMSCGRDIPSARCGGLSGGGSAKAVAVDAKAHASQAHQARVKHSRLWEQRVGIRRAYAPGAPPHPDDDELS